MDNIELGVLSLAETEQDNIKSTTESMNRTPGLKSQKSGWRGAINVNANMQNPGLNPGQALLCKKAKMRQGHVTKLNLRLCPSKDLNVGQVLC